MMNACANCGRPVDPAMAFRFTTVAERLFCSRECGLAFHRPPSEEAELLDSEIESLNETPMRQLRFRDFASVKAGRDQWSGKRLASLRLLVSIEALRAAEEAFAQDEKLLACCLRWILRGLHPEKAIRKVRTDNDVAANAAMSRAARRR